jgi:membrane protein involved in colicin uptake
VRVQANSTAASAAPVPQQAAVRVRLVVFEAIALAVAVNLVDLTAISGAHRASTKCLSYLFDLELVAAVRRRVRVRRVLLAGVKQQRERERLRERLRERGRERERERERERLREIERERLREGERGREIETCPTP